MSIKNCTSSYAEMSKYERLQEKMLHLFTEGETLAQTSPKREAGKDDRLDKYLGQLRDTGQQMSRLVNSLEGRVSHHQLEEYQRDLEKLHQKISAVEGLFCNKGERIEHRPDEGKWDNEAPLPEGRPSACLPEGIQLSLFDRLSLEEVSEARDVNHEWNRVYRSAIEKEVTQLAASIYPDSPLEAQTFGEKLYTFLVAQSGERGDHGIDQLSNAECFLLAALLANDIEDLKQERSLSSTFPLLHGSLTRALNMRAIIASKGDFNRSVETINSLKTLVGRLVDADATSEALRVIALIPCEWTQSLCLQLIALKKIQTPGSRLKEVIAIVHNMPDTKIKEDLPEVIARELISAKRTEEAMQFILHCPVDISRICDLINQLNKQDALPRAISFARKLESPYKQSEALQYISSILMEKPAPQEAISVAREMPYPLLKRRQFHTLVAQLADRKLFREAKELAEESIALPDGERGQRWRSMECVVGKLAEAGHFKEACTWAHEKITDPFYLSSALNRVIPCLLPEDHRPWSLEALGEAVAIARSIPDLDTRSSALLELVQKHIDSNHHSQAQDLRATIPTPQDNAFGLLLERISMLWKVRKIG